VKVTVSRCFRFRRGAQSLLLPHIVTAPKARERGSQRDVSCIEYAAADAARGAAAAGYAQTLEWHHKITCKRRRENRPKGTWDTAFLLSNSRLDDAHEAPGHRRGNAEEVLAANRRRGGSLEEGVRHQ
jgi:hypothetical protein